MKRQKTIGLKPSVDELLDELDAALASFGVAASPASASASRASARRRRRFGLLAVVSLLGVGAGRDVDALGALVVGEVEDRRGGRARRPPRRSACRPSLARLRSVAAAAAGLEASARRSAERRPPADALAVRASPARSRDRLARVGEHLRRRASRYSGDERRRSPRASRASGTACRVEVVLDVAAAALDEVAREAAALARSCSSLERSSGRSPNVGSRKPSERAEGVLVAQCGVAVTRIRWRLGVARRASRRAGSAGGGRRGRRSRRRRCGPRRR